MILKRKIEILELIKKRIANSKKLSICDSLTISLLKNKIDREEYHIIKDLLDNNRPTPDNEYKQFINNEYWQSPNQQNIVYWWYPLSAETSLIRIDYLTELIANSK